MGTKTEEHESYGTIQISRVIGGRDNKLFSSSILHNNFIRLSINHAEIERNLNHDWVHARDPPIVEVFMSETQFAEAITSIGMGGGTPVTIKSINNKRMSEPPYISKIKQFNNEFDERMSFIVSEISKSKTSIKEILSKKNITKTDREAIDAQLAHIFQEIKSNLPYINKQFTEQMANTVKESKGEVEAFILNKIHSTGLKALKENQDLMITDESAGEDKT